MSQRNGVGDLPHPQLWMGELGDPVPGITCAGGCRFGVGLASQVEAKFG